MITAPRDLAKRSHSTKLHGTKLLALAAVLALGGSLAACTPKSPEETATTAGTGPSSSASASPTAGATPDASPSSTAGATGAATSAPASPPPPPSSAPASQATELCTAAELTGSLDDTGGGAAGHIYMKLILANSSGTDCILDGYPGVSMVKAGTTDPIGAPAVRDPQAPSNGPIPLAPGQSASAVLSYAQAGNYQGCQQVQAGSVLVYPPSAFDSLEIPHPLTACSNANIELLTIGAFQP